MRHSKTSSSLSLPLVCGFILAGCSSLSPKIEGGPKNLAELHFTTFAVETFVPLKRENIELQASCHLRMDGAELRALLDGMWNRAESGVVDELVIRLKMTFEAGNTVFVDRDGGIEWQERKGQRNLTPSDMKVLAGKMRAIAQTHGCE